MKDFIYTTIIVFLVLFIVVDMYLDEVERNLNLSTDKITLIWNADDERIPQDGGIVKIEFTDENIVYICPISYKDSTIVKCLNDNNISY